MVSHLAGEWGIIMPEVVRVRRMCRLLALGDGVLAPSIHLPNGVAVLRRVKQLPVRLSRLHASLGLLL